MKVVLHPPRENYFRGTQVSRSSTDLESREHRDISNLAHDYPPIFFKAAPSFPPLGPIDIQEGALLWDSLGRNGLTMPPSMDYAPREYYGQT